MSAEGDPVLDSVPPETDYITYLTILEYQLTPESLPSLLKVLQNDTLTENIGWDLVHLLIPMLPLSKDCLDLIARKGNPREVIIRVTEYLTTLSEENDHHEKDGLRTFEGEADRVHLGNMTLEGMPPNEDASENKPKADASTTEEHQIQAYSALLSMLSVLHPRIKSKYPSRFLATSLPAALAAYRTHITHYTTTVFLDFLANLSGRRKPALPPRISSDGPAAPAAQVSLPDPEAEDVSRTIPDDEKALIRRLLQAVALEICEDYVSSLDRDFQGLAWSSRIRESIFPGKVVPGKKTATESFKTDIDLVERDDTMDKILETCFLLGLHPTAVIQELIKPKHNSNNSAPIEEPDSPKEFPTDPKDIPFSTPGSLGFLTAYQTFSRLNPESKSSPQPLDISSNLLDLNYLFVDGDTFLGNADMVIDSILALNLSEVAVKRTQQSPELEDFLEYLRPFVMFSADDPNPEWRNNSHLLVTKGLEQTSDETLRLQIIKTFLSSKDAGPRLLIKGSAIGWLKDQILAAKAANASDNVFLQPAMIDDLSDKIFWDLSDVVDLDEESLVMTVAPTLSNIATALNFYYLLAASPALRETFQPSSIAECGSASLATVKVVSKFVDQVEKLVMRLNTLDEEEIEGLQSDIMVIGLCLDSIRSLS